MSEQRLIDANVLKEKYLLFGYIIPLSEKEIDSIPTIDTMPVVHGHWDWDKNGMDWGIGAWRCSECKGKSQSFWSAIHNIIPTQYAGSKYCGNCGAKMDEVEI